MHLFFTQTENALERKQYVLFAIYFCLTLFIFLKLIKFNKNSHQI